MDEAKGSSPSSSSSLSDILASTVRNNGQIREAMGDVEVARAQLAQANAAWYPKASAIVIGAPIFEETGNPSLSTSNWNRWGPYVRAGTEVAQPLFTFGLISNYQKAAENQIVAKEKLAEGKRNDIVLTAKEMYYSYLMATDLHRLVENLSKFLSEAIDTVEKNSKDKSASVKPHDLYRLKTALDDLEQKRLYAAAAKMTAEKAVLWVSGLQSAGIIASELVPEQVERKKLEDYLDLAKASRPEYSALAAGQAARAALRDAKRAQSYPIIFLGGFVDYAWSPVREKQPSIFASDPFNRLTGGIGLGLKFDLEFAKHAAEASEQEAEYMKLKATETYAVPGIELQVKKAFWELEQAVGSLEIAKRRKETSKKWFVSSAMGWSVGITPPKDLMEALEGDGLARKNYIETVFAYNLALARLSQSVGREVTELKY